MPLLEVLETLVRYHKNYEFRIRPTTVTVTYESRAYLIDEKQVFHWTSTGIMPQSETLKLYGGQARWIEETQTKTYEVTI